MSSLTKEELKKVTHIYDVYGEHFRTKAKDPVVLRKIQQEIVSLNERNQDILLSNIIGKQLLINQKTEDNILKLLDIDREEMKKVIKESEYFKTFGDLKLIDQLVFAIPLILYSMELNIAGKKTESQLIYLLTFYKPYASRISYFFKYGVKEDQMAYTVEHLSERYDIKRLGDLFSVLTKMSLSSYNNYIESAVKDRVLTDAELHVTYNSGVATRVNSMIGSIVEEYRKNEGKSLNFDAAYQTVYDKDDDSSDIEDADIASDAAIKNSIVHKVLMRVTKDPVDRKLVVIAAQNGFGSSSQYYRDILTTAINEITDKMLEDLPDFFSSVIGSFLFNINPSTGEKYTMTEFKTPVFIKAAMDIFKMKNLKDVNLLKVKEYINKMLENCSSDYLNFGATQQRNFRNALYFYWILMIRNNQ